MRVLAVGSMYPPDHVGSYELVWRSAMRHLRSEGHAARVLAGDYRADTPDPEDPETFRELRSYWRDHDWPRIGWRDRIALERENAATLERHLEQFEPDVISWWSMGGMSLSLIERVRRDGRPAVAFVADDWLLYGRRVDRWTGAFRRGAAGRLARLIRLPAWAERTTGIPIKIDLDGAAHFVLASGTVRERARTVGGLRLYDSEIVHPGVDRDFLGLRPEQPWSWRLLYVGRVEERKGVLDAVAALAELPEQATLTVAGGGDPRQLETLRAFIGRLGLEERVRLIGMRRHAELPEIYEAADVVLFPSRWLEPWGLVPLEAMALGRPVVATGIGGSREYLDDGENCVLCEPGDPAALARAVRALADAPELRDRLRRGGERTARSHTDTVFNEAVLRALERAVGGSGGPG